MNSAHTDFLLQHFYVGTNYVNDDLLTSSVLVGEQAGVLEQAGASAMVWPLRAAYWFGRRPFGLIV